MIRFRFFRKFIKRHFAPVPKDTSQDIRINLSKLYLFISLNAMGLVLFYSIKNKVEFTMNVDSEGKSTVEKWMKTLDTQDKLKYYKVTGLHIESTAEFEPEKKV